MSKPRNPRYFPRMKVRGAQRRRLANWHRAQRSIDQTEAGMLRLAAAAGLSAMTLRQLYIAFEKVGKA